MGQIYIQQCSINSENVKLKGPNAKREHTDTMQGAHLASATPCHHGHETHTFTYTGVFCINVSVFWED